MTIQQNTHTGSETGNEIEFLLTKLESSINSLAHKINDYVQANGASPGLKKKTKKLIQKITKPQKKQ